MNVTKHPHDIGVCPAWDAEGVELARWIEIISGQCVYGPLGAVSWSFGIPGNSHMAPDRVGYLSILSWLCAQLPQIITNYQNSSVDGLAPIFLINWFMVCVLSYPRLTHSGGYHKPARMYIDSSTAVSDSVGMLLRSSRFRSYVSICLLQDLVPSSAAKPDPD